MVKILHIGDLHLGVDNFGRFVPGAGFNTRVEDYLRCLDAALEHAPGVDLILFAGDVYKNCVPGPTVQREFGARVLRASRHAPVIIIPGNHDVPNMAGRASSVDIFTALELERVRVLRGPEAIHVSTAAGPAIVAALPFVPPSLLVSRDEAAGMSIEEARVHVREKLVGWIDGLLVPGVARLREELGEETPAVLLSHYTVGGAQFGGYRGLHHGGEVELPPSALARPEFDYVALGHIHRHQRIGLPGDQPPVVYAGSVERVDFSEENEEKVVVTAEVARHHAVWQRQPLPARRFLTIRVDADPEDATPSVLAAVEGRAEQVAGSVVRLIYTLPRGLPNVAEAQLRQALAGAHYVAAIRRELPPQEVRQRHAGLSTHLSPLDALREYLRTRDDLRDREEELVRHAVPLIEELEASRSAG